MAENRSAYIVTEKGTYTENNQHFASYRPVIMSSSEPRSLFGPLALMLPNRNSGLGA